MVWQVGSTGNRYRNFIGLFKTWVIIDMTRVLTKTWKNQNKFNAKGRHYAGMWFDSTGEMNYYQELEWRRKAGEIKDIECQVKIPLDVNGVHITNYYIDFVVTHNDGSHEYIEFKGMEMPLWKMKWNLLTALMDEIDPGSEMTLVKMKSYKPFRKVSSR